MVREKSPSVMLVCLLALFPLYAAGYLAPVDRAVGTICESVLSPDPLEAAGPSPRELALRRLVDRTSALLESEGRFIEKVRVMEIARIAERAGLRYQLSPSLILSVIHTESHFQRDAVSPDGAMGLMQLQFGTAQYLSSAAGIQLETSETLFDPEKNIVLGTGYLRQLIDRFGDVKTALAAYHLGPTAIGRRLDDREPFSDRYGHEIRARELYFTTSAPVGVVASAALHG